MGRIGGNRLKEVAHSNLQEGEVSIVSCEHNLEVPHHHLTLLVELAQCLVLVLGVAGHTQTVQGPRAHYSTQRHEWQGAGHKFSAPSPISWIAFFQGYSTGPGSSSLQPYP